MKELKILTKIARIFSDREQLPFYFVGEIKENVAITYVYSKHKYLSIFCNLCFNEQFVDELQGIASGLGVKLKFSWDNSSFWIGEYL